MLEIQLTQGKITQIDDIDFDLMNFNWCALKGGTKCLPRWYAMRAGPKINGKRTPNIYIHRVVLERKIKRPLKNTEMVDHIDHDGLNNCRDNLRLATCQQNLQNRRKNPSKSSKYKGVIWDKNRQKWMARLVVNGISIHLGRFDNETEAAKQYDNAARETFGEFCCMNFKRDD